MAGMTVDWRYGAYQVYWMWLVKTDCLGNDTTWDVTNCGNPNYIAEPKLNYELNIYPNPSSDKLNVEVDKAMMNGHLSVVSSHSSVVNGQSSIGKLFNI